MGKAVSTLYSYCIPIDNGAAPNPFWGICTLAICKPVIRRVAQRGDWIVGTGSVDYGFQNRVVYAMRVDEIMSYREYDVFCKEKLQEKIPDWNSSDLKRKVGDCIYSYETGQPKLRRSVHKGEEIIKRDLRGKNVLLSKHFCYFGSNPRFLKDSLSSIVLQGQGHKSRSNAPYVEEFIDWIERLIQEECADDALPYGFANWLEGDCDLFCTARHILEDDDDERIGECL